MGENGYRNTLAAGTLLHGGAYSYRIERVLGQGSFGITYLASVNMQGALGSIDANVKVAIKEFFMREINGREGSTVTSGSKGGIFADYRRMFMREAANLSKLRHPNIIKVLECFEANGTSYYVMEYIEGSNLNDYITQSNGLSEYDALCCVQSIAQAIDFMHEHKMLHLDVKPLNIMRRCSGELILIDFGLSKQFDENGNPESSTHIGGSTIGYAPLEQHTYKKGIGFPATLDIYALGATLYKCITGITPPDASVILNEGFPEDELQTAGVSQDIVNIVKRAMEPIVNRRIQSAAELINLIQALIPCADRSLKQRNEFRVDVDDDRTQDTTKPVFSRDCVMDSPIFPRYGDMDIDDETRKAINDLLHLVKECKSGCKVVRVPLHIYDIIMKTNDSHSIGWYQITLGIFEIMRFIDRLQSLTGLHWRLPDRSELFEAMDDDTLANYNTTGHSDGAPKALYFNLADVSLYGVQEFSGDTGELKFKDFYYGKFYCTLVVDPLKGDCYQTISSCRHFNIEYTVIIVDKKGLWHFGLCPIRIGSKWAIIDKYGKKVTDFIFENEPYIGFLTYPSPGPLPMPLLRVGYTKADREGYYRVLPNGKLEHEIECSEERWKERETWT